VGNALAVGIFGAEVILLRIDHVVLGPGDLAQHGARGQLLGVQPHALHDLLDDGLLVVLVVDGEGAGQASLPTFRASMSRRSMRTQSEWKVQSSGLASEEWSSSRSTRSPISLGGLVGEGDGQDGVRRDAFFADQPGNAAGDDAGLARSGPGQNQQRAFGGLDGGALFGIQVGELRLQGATVQAGRVLRSSVPAPTCNARESVPVSQNLADGDDLISKLCTATYPKQNRRTANPSGSRISGGLGSLNGSDKLP
jgi:hypothetical protein